MPEGSVPGAALGARAVATNATENNILFSNLSFPKKRNMLY